MVIQYNNNSHDKGANTSFQRIEEKAATQEVFLCTR